MWSGKSFSSSPPTSLLSTPTDPLYLNSLVPTLQLPDIALLVDLVQTDPCPQTSQKLQNILLHQVFINHLPVLLNRPEGNSLTVLLTLTVFCLTGHLWIYILKRVNCLMTRMLLLPTPTNPSLKNRLTEKLRGGLGLHGVDAYPRL